MLTPPTQQTVLAVGGLDPTGAAGILIDAAAIRAIGLHAAAVLAVTTVQTGTRFVSQQTVPAGAVRAAVEQVLAGLAVGAVKTGALGGAEVVEMLAELAGRPGFPPLVVDPVVRSSTGGELLSTAGVDALRRRLVRRAALITPNLDEASLLSGVAVRDAETMRRAASQLIAAGARAVLVKGGHLAGEAIYDFLLDDAGNEQLLPQARRLPYAVRGTGCALAALIAAGLASGRTLGLAVAEGRQRLFAAMEQAASVGSGPRVLVFEGRHR